MSSFAFPIKRCSSHAHDAASGGGTGAGAGKRRSDQSRHWAPTSQSGQALIEFAIVAMPILLAGAAIIEVARWQAARMMAGMALLEGARAASTQHGNPDTLQTAFEHALRPWFAANGTHRDSASRQRASFAATEANLSQAPYRIQIDSPHDGHFAQFADPNLTLAAAGGRKIINVDYVAEQHARRTGRSAPRVSARPDAPSSGDTIFDATTLKLRLTYLHTPIVPGVRAIIRLLAPSREAFGASAMAQGVIPIQRDISLEMHSHPVQWTTPTHAMARVVHTRSATSGPLPASHAPPRWQWGQPSIGQSGGSGKPPASETPDVPGPWRPIEEPGSPTTDPPTVPGEDQAEEDSGVGSGGEGSDADAETTDPACGTVICCDP